MMKPPSRLMKARLDPLQMLPCAVHRKAGRGRTWTVTLPSSEPALPPPRVFARVCRRSWPERLSSPRSARHLTASARAWCSLSARADMIPLSSTFLSVAFDPSARLVHALKHDELFCRLNLVGQHTITRLRCRCATRATSWTPR
jgi:hypothetical protein